MEPWMGEKREEIQSERETHREPVGVGGRRKASDRRGEEEEEATEENRREMGSSVRLVPARHPILRSLSPSILPHPSPRTTVPRALR